MFSSLINKNDSNWKIAVVKEEQNSLSSAVNNHSSLI